LFVEGDASRRFQIRIYAGSGGDAVVQRGDARKAGFELGHRAREGIAQAGDELKQ
jgi:hypothetical protein